MSSCEICGGRVGFYFRKNYESSPYSRLDARLGVTSSIFDVKTAALFFLLVIRWHLIRIGKTES